MSRPAWSADFRSARARRARSPRTLPARRRSSRSGSRRRCWWPSCCSSRRRSPRCRAWRCRRFSSPPACASSICMNCVRCTSSTGARSAWRSRSRSACCCSACCPACCSAWSCRLARLLVEVARPRDALLRRLPTDRRFHDLADDEGGATTPAVLVYRLYAPMIFANARYVADRLRALADVALRRCAASCSTCRRSRTST